MEGFFQNRECRSSSGLTFDSGGIFAVHNDLLVIAHRPPIYFLIYSFELIWE